MTKDETTGSGGKEGGDEEPKLPTKLDLERKPKSKERRDRRSSMHTAEVWKAIQDTNELGGKTYA